MKATRRWLMIFAALLMAFAFIACDESDDETDNEAISGKVLNLSGGEASEAYDGGAAGSISIYGIGAGGIEIRKEGSVDDDFDFPDNNEVVDLGENGWEIDDDITVMVYGDAPTTVSVAPSFKGVGVLADPEPAAPSYHTHFGSSYLVYGDGGVTYTDTVVTGLQVNKHATVTFEMNSDFDGSSEPDCYNMVDLQFNNDVNIRGTVTVTSLPDGIGCDVNPEFRHEYPAIDGDKGALRIYADQIYVGENGTIDTSGDDGLDERGGDGGAVILIGWDLVRVLGDILANGGDGDVGEYDGGNGSAGASYTWAGVLLQSYMGHVINRGKIDASGGDGYNGGQSGAIGLWTFGSVWNKGKLDASGGEGDKDYGYGGSSSGVTLWNSKGVIYNQGDILANGGGGGYGGGDGGFVMMGPNYMMMMMGYPQIEVVNTGSININGGDALYDGEGGDAGALQALAYGWDVISTGRIEGSGGIGSGDFCYGDCSGGDGAQLVFYSTISAENIYSDNMQITPFGGVTIGNNIIAKGGDADGNYEDGGEGGDLLVGQYIPWYFWGYVNAADGWMDQMDTDPIRLIGFDKILLNGGKGDFDGGDGGTLEAESEDFYFNYDFDDEYFEAILPAGPIVNNVPIEANGGYGYSYGGNGGGLDLDSYGYVMDGDARVENHARVELKGGDSEYYAGGGGYLDLYGDVKVINGGTIIAEGGDGAYGGYGGGNKPLDAMGKTEGGRSFGHGGFAFLGNGAMMIQAKSGGTIAASHHVINNDIISVSGGYGVHSGGNAGMIILGSEDRADNAGTLRARGGNSEDIGGHGGYVNVLGYRSDSKIGKVDVRGGNGGEEDGLIGIIYFDLIDVTPEDGTIGF